MNGLDFEGLAERLLGQCRELLPSILPGGRLVGREYMCGGIAGGPGDSLRFNVKTGAWADFASDDLKGGDVISLYAAVKNMPQGDAAKELAGQIGFELKKNGVHWAAEAVPIPPSPHMAPPTMNHATYGIPSDSWCYRNADGQPMFYVARYETEGGKQLLPWSWVGGRWVSKGWPAPRPLYGLNVLKAMPEAPVLVCEGEKAVEAARTMLGTKYAVVTWPNGSNAVDKADWTPLKGRKVLIWPDADAPGIKAAMAIAGIPGPESVKLINTQGQPDRWDAADAAKEGWDFRRFVEWAKPRLQPITININPPAEEAAVEASPSIQAVWDEIGVATTPQGHPICNMDNIMRILSRHKDLAGTMWADDFYNRIFSTWNSPGKREWRDVDTLDLTHFIQSELGISKITDDVVYKTVCLYAEKNKRNEPRDWMDTLVWDKTPRISKFFAGCFGAIENAYSSAASTNFWIGIAARIYQPGCQLDNMVVLEGAQGIGKTQALRRIGGEWYTNSIESIQNKDFFQNLRGKLIVEIAELDAFSKADITRIKSAISSANDDYRASYGKFSEKHNRMCIFVGSTNEKNYLRDSTGNRRFWPIACSKVDIGLIEETRDQLFAEAVARYKAGESWYHMPGELTKSEQEDRRHVDEWENIIREFLEGKDIVSLREIGEMLKLGTDKLSLMEQKRITSALRASGWERRSSRDGVKIAKSWFPKTAPTKHDINSELGEF